jgi:hypothetical protein
MTGWFQYGTTTAYGSETAHQDLGSPAAGSVVPLSQRVTGLSPSTTYHFRACALRAGSKDCDGDRTFKTGSDKLPAGFEETVAFSGLDNPTALRFSPDGRVFVAEKSGLIKVFDGLDDASPTVFADLRTEGQTTGIAGC